MEAVFFVGIKGPCRDHWKIRLVLVKPDQMHLRLHRYSLTMHAPHSLVRLGRHLFAYMVRNWKDVGFAQQKYLSFDQKSLLFRHYLLILNSFSLSIFLFRSRFFFDYGDDSLKINLLFLVLYNIYLLLFNGRFSKESIDSDCLFWLLYFSKLKYVVNMLEKYKKIWNNWFVILYRVWYIWIWKDTITYIMIKILR